MRFVYLLLCIAGTALPLAQFVPWLSANGLNVPLLLQQTTSSNIAAFAWADVLISGLADHRIHLRRRTQAGDASLVVTAIQHRGWPVLGTPPVSLSQGAASRKKREEIR